ncbi:MAG: ABC transporter ATP-binding protein [Deltaproteobacteria bacterium]|nr:ABC transporter ATP-binding protein [Deltaproteobacteria bacterium]MBW2382064.1 ABC transporter ATP-binding protein [Deltaproteobacteria bacterium]MBW2697359.1 ABC transporter ATP-binding protein [Deltaproteobacteria bacterium]
MSTPLFSVIGLEKRFGAVAALRGVDLELPRGGALAILGPNGAGKSTLLRIMAGLAHPSAGRVELEGGKARGASIGYLGHATLLYPELTAHENLVFACRLHRRSDPASRADTLLAEEGLAEVAHRRAGGFSRGMAQRLSIARARVHDPEVLLLDEPFTGLDRRSADRLTERLRELRDAGHALVLVTHDVGQAAALSDEVVILIEGRVQGRHHGVSASGLETAYEAALESRSAARR